jgi:DNA (cytosine-5)-methyltransferase 1
MSKSTRPPVLRTSFALDAEELVIDNFAGGGGASTGIEAAIGRPVDMAINHSPEAIAMHAVNHPHTRHFCENIWEVDPREACGSRPVGLAWFSPDCTHFSRAKGGRPVKKEIRALAWVVIRWAKAVAPRVIVLENVEEFQNWGPLLEDGRPDPDQVGTTFRQWLSELTACGYEVEFKPLIAADYGTPTTRKRLFLVARRDRNTCTWPTPSHGAGRQPWRPAAEIIDWSLPCPSIFGRKKPLADATMRRIAAGVRRYVIDAGAPFIIPLTHQGADRSCPLTEPVRTVTCAHRGELALICPTLIQTGYGERKGQAPRVPGLGKPLGAVVAGGSKHALVAALLSKHYGGVVGHGMRRPIGTVTARDHHALTTAFLTKFYNTNVGSSLDAPVPTITARAGGGHLGEVRAFLLKYYGADEHGQQLEHPLHTVTTKDRFGLVLVHGEPYVIADIGIRMLQPHELFAAQGFPTGYKIAPEYKGKPLTKTAQTALAGNSVCPQVAQAIVDANVVRKVA